MCKKFLIWILLFIFISPLYPSTQKSQKVYELIYKDVQLLRQKILKMEGAIQKNQDDIQIIKEQIGELLRLNRLFAREQASIKEEQSKIPTQYQVLIEKLNNITDQFSRISADLLEIKQGALPAVEQQVEEDTSQNPPVGEFEGETQEQVAEEKDLFPISPNLSHREVYDIAISDYRKGNYLLSIEGFSIYIEQFPESPLADNAKYWIGECFYSQGKFEEAIEQFNDLILSYPQSDKLPAAYLKKGMSLMNLEKNIEAISVLKLLITKYPLEEETKIAQEKLKELGVGNA